MEISGSNALNRSMQGLWSAHRRAKFNINSSAPPSSGPTPMPESPREPAPAQSVDEAESSAEVPILVPPVTDFEEGSSALATIQPSTTGKRKTRTTRINEDGTKRIKLANQAVKDYTPPAVRPSDIGGADSSIDTMRELVIMPLQHPEVYLHIGVQPARGILLHGPPGCGKTLLAHAIAGEAGVPFIRVSAPSIVSGMSGESEKTLRETFEDAKRLAPCILFIDEIDAITPKRESAQREMERRIVAQFLTCMDELSLEQTNNRPVIVIGATNRPDSLDAALRRAGRFDREISMGVPDDQARAQILRKLCSKLKLQGDFNFMALAKATPGYVGADLAALTSTAGIIAVKRIFQELSENEHTTFSGSDTMAIDGPSDQAVLIEAQKTPRLDKTSGSSIIHFLRAHPTPLDQEQLLPLCVTFDDFTLALKEVQPSAKREGFATVPDITWADIGALHATREELHMAIVQPIRHPEIFNAVGIDAACGVLLWGPPGCGKTLLAKAVANESRANFISVKGPELLNKYVGESERAVRQVFTRARASSPCVVFFDELDALVPRRDDNMSESSARVVNTLLTELDGLDARKSVYVIAATNRPDMIDPAMCRPGRLDKLLFVDLPSADERAEIVRTLTRKIPLGFASGDTTDSAVAVVRTAIASTVREQCDGYSGADLAAVVREAGVAALRRTLGAIEAIEDSSGSIVNSVLRVSAEDFVTALGKVHPSVSASQRKRYEALRRKFAGLPVKTSTEEIDKVIDGAQEG
ncbi:P-loop containing nucleoside triphosphate hydrolase protein [Irpex rosettiformis]|uniref:P-loop containing nucleoside triphosphate hydrolase protein n=1 Tax=Irpex rosettiformis TaxID=378272 RepID=A0ACB8TQP2_9APHY|nr:P-loop containing nucleoside triphosphate hydrolase protein [Irpex rosettiformis]